MNRTSRTPAKPWSAIALMAAMVFLTTSGAAPGTDPTAATPLSFTIEEHADYAGAVTVPQAIKDAAEPTEWTRDEATGLRHRLTTAEERATNGWPLGSMLIEAQTIDAAQPQLTVPIPGEGLRTLDFDTEVPLGTVEATSQSVDGDAITRAISTTRYMHEAPDGVYRLFISNDGGMHANGFLAAMSIDVFGTEPGRELSDLPGSPEDIFLVIAETVPGLTINTGHCPHPLLEVLCNLLGFYPACNDGVDNDGDNWVDFPSDPGCSGPSDDNEFDSRYTNYFGMFGEIKWCTKNSANWATLAAALASDINNGFDGNGGVRADMVHGISHCWTATSQANANTCDTSGGCTDSSGHSYPFNGCSQYSYCYRNNAWADVTHARLHNSFIGLKAVQVIHDGLMSSSSGGSLNLCGLSRFPASGVTAGDSVTLGSISGTGCKGYVWTHEMGHSFDAMHGSATSVGTCHTVMQSSSASTCRVNYFSNSNRIRINNCVPNSWCPRSGTG